MTGFLDALPTTPSLDGLPTTAAVDALVARARTAVWSRVDESFRCCDTDFSIHVTGPAAARRAAAGRSLARRLEGRLNAFADDSAVARLNRDGRVDDPHVAALVRRGLAYADRTGGAFDVRYGTIEHALKEYIRGETDAVPDDFAPASVSVDGTTVTTDRPLDLNGLAKGYVVDRVYQAVTDRLHGGFVDGGGDVARPTGPVGVESPYGDETPLRVLDTDWNVASSGGYRRRRGDANHVYRPGEGRVGTDHDVVTVVARRDCTEADALATTLSASSVEDGLALVNDWDGAEALVVHGGVFHRTEGFREHELHH